MTKHAEALGTDAPSSATRTHEDKHSTGARMDVLQTLGATADVAANVATALVKVKPRFHELRSRLEPAKHIFLMWLIDPPPAWRSMAAAPSWTLLADPVET